MGENGETIRKGIEMMNEGKVAEVVDLYHDDASIRSFGSVLGGTYRGKRELGEFFLKVGQTYPGGLKLEVENLVEQGDRVFVEWNAKAVLSNGKPLETKAVNVFEFRGPKVSQHRVYLDSEELARELGRM